jgi:uncharacterized RDD family membrane protein YckC
MGPTDPIGPVTWAGEVRQMSDLVIAEGVELALRPARLATRFAAFLLDLAIQYCIALVLFGLVGIASLGDDPDTTHALAILVAVVVFLGYPVLCETLSTGRSVGKAAVGLRVVRLDGGPERFRHALVRALSCWFADIGLSGGLAGCCTSASSAKGQRIGDLLAGTIVVRERGGRSRGVQPVPPPPALASWIAAASVQDVPVGLVIATRQLISRIPQLDRGAAAELATELARELGPYVHPAPPPGTPAYHYLVAVTSERFRREAGTVGLYQYPQQPVAVPQAGGRHL